MEKNKLNVAFGFGIFGVFFLSGIILLSTNFISRSLTFVVMSNMNYMTDIPVINEPILFVLSIVCFIVSFIALIKSILLLKEGC
jgi:virB6 protein